MDKLKKKALRLGASDLRKSKKKGKKYDVIYNGKVVSFGHSKYQDFTQHKDKERRDRYRARHSKIKLKDGRLAYRVKGTPAYFSWYLLWDWMVDNKNNIIYII